MPATRFVVELSPLRLRTPTTRGVALAMGSNIVLAGGLTAAGTTGDLVSVPIVSGQMTVDGQLRHPVHDAAAVALGTTMLVLGGGATTQDTWVQRLLVGGTSVLQGRLPSPRADLGAVVVGSEAIIVGGGAGGQADARVLATHDGVHFRLVARLPVAVRYAAIAAVKDRVFVIGGVAAGRDVATIQVVDVPAGKAWVAGRLRTTISHATALTIAGSIIVAGGRHAGQALDSVIAIDPTTLAARAVARLPRALSDAAGVIVGDVGYLIGGEAAQPLATIVTIASSTRWPR